MFTELSFKPGVFERRKKQQNKKKILIFFISLTILLPIFRDNNNTNNIIILLRVYLPFCENSVVSFTIYRFNHYLFCSPDGSLPSVFASRPRRRWTFTRMSQVTTYSVKYYFIIVYRKSNRAVKGET